jgi:hypothetical protein
VDEREIRAAVAENPDACEELYWGQAAACVVVALQPPSASLLRESLTEAWLQQGLTIAGQAVSRQFVILGSALSHCAAISFTGSRALVFSHLAYCVAESPARPGKTAATPDSAIRIRWTEGPLLSGSAHAAMTWAVDRFVFNSFLIRCAPRK